MMAAARGWIRVRDTKFWGWLRRIMSSYERLVLTLLMLDTGFGVIGGKVMVDSLFTKHPLPTGSVSTAFAGGAVLLLCGVRIWTKTQQIESMSADKPQTSVPVITRSVCTMLGAVALAIASLLSVTERYVVVGTVLAGCWFAVGAASMAFLLINGPFPAERAQTAELLAELRDKLGTNCS